MRQLESMTLKLVASQTAFRARVFRVSKPLGQNDAVQGILESDSLNTAITLYGPDGFTNDKYVQNKNLMPYTIEFENKKSSLVPVSVMSIKGQLDTAVLDVSSFQFSSYGWGDTTIYAPVSNDDFLFGDFDLRPDTSRTAVSN